MLSSIKKIVIVASLAMIMQQATALPKFNFKKSTNMFSNKAFINKSSQSNFAKFKNSIGKASKKSFGSLKINAMKFKTPALLTTALTTAAYISISNMNNEVIENVTTKNIVDNEQDKKQHEMFKVYELLFERAHEQAKKQYEQSITLEEKKITLEGTDTAKAKSRARITRIFAKKFDQEIENYRNYIMQREFHKCSGSVLGSFDPEKRYPKLPNDIFFSDCVKTGFDAWNYDVPTEEEVTIWKTKVLKKYGVTPKEFDNILHKIPVGEEYLTFQGCIANDEGTEYICIKQD